MKLNKAQQNGINQWLFILKTVNQLENRKKRILDNFNDLNNDKDFECDNYWTDFKKQTVYQKINMVINIELSDISSKFDDVEIKFYKKCHVIIWSIIATKLFSDILTYDNVKKQIEKI